MNTQKAKDAWSGIGRAIKEGGPLAVAMAALILVGYLLLKPNARPDPYTGTMARQAWQMQDVANADNLLTHNQILIALDRLDSRMDAAEVRMKEHSGLSHHLTSESEAMFAMIAATLKDINRRLTRIEAKLDGD